jgi:1L-myo-inositol 1-phosphate cytidylyltransferase
MQAIILAAGQGTRLRSVSPSKPLTQLAGRPLLHHVLDRLRAAGVTRPLVVTGYGADAVEAAAAAWSGGDAETLLNPLWAEPNGVTVLAAAPFLADRALLVMADHLASPKLYAAVARASVDPAGLTLGIDRRLGHSWVDEEDVTRVATRNGAIAAIGKQIATYDAYDTGVFLITPGLMAALAALPSPGLSDGVRALAREGRATTADVSAYDWIDIDDPRALAQAERWLATSD